MTLSQGHNRTHPPAAEKPYGIRVRLLQDDPFRQLVDAGWENCHWFADRRTRDEALADMSERHRYSRIGDEPRLVFESIDPAE